MEIYDVLLIIVLMMLIYRLCDRSYLAAAPTADELTYQLNLSGLCQANAERNQKLYDDVQRYKKAEDERKKKQDELIGEQQALNNMLKIRLQSQNHLMHGVDPSPYENGDYAYVAGDCIDSRVTKKMISSNLSSKEAIDNRIRWNADVFGRYVRPELKEYENMIWWENEMEM